MMSIRYAHNHRNSSSKNWILLTKKKSVNPVIFICESIQISNVYISDAGHFNIKSRNENFYQM